MRACLALLLVAAPLLASGQVMRESTPAVFVDDSMDRGNAVAEMLRGVANREKRIRAGVRLFIPLTIDDGGLGALTARLNHYPADTPMWLLMPGPADANSATAWRETLQRVLATAAQRATVLEIAVSRAPAELTSFALRVAATEARARNERIQIALGGPAAHDIQGLRGLLTPDVAPYVDLLATQQRPDAGVEQTATLLSEVDPTAAIAWSGAGLSEPPSRAARECVRVVMSGLGTIRTFAFAGTPTALEACISALAPAAPLLNGDVVALDADTAGLTVRIDGQDARAQASTRLLFEQQQQSTWLIYETPAGNAPLAIELRLATDGRPTLLDLESKAAATSPVSTRDAATSITRIDVPRTGHVMLLGFNEGETSGFTDRTGVTATRALSVEEIIARHQQQQRGQDAVVDNYVASARTEQHFRPTVTDAGYDVVSDNVYFVDREGIEWEERTFSVNGSKWGADRPPFPMMQPEKVLSLPMDLRLGDDYRYRLVGDAVVDDVPCYELAFEPIRQDRSLYRGTMWISRESFVRVRIRAVQTNLSAPVVSNEETQTYKTVATVDGRPIVLLSELVARQIVMIAGRNLLLEKRAVFDTFRVNADDFADLRQAARSSDRIMFRETDQGLRYYNKEAGRRVVSERDTSHAKALAMGLLVDPSYDLPVLGRTLPIFGINYLDFDFQGRSDTQLAILFAGVLAAGNIQRPKLGRTPLDASIDFFAMAPPSTDRLFDGEQERENERLLTWPLSASVNIGWQANAFLKLSTQYQFRFDGFVRDTTTDESFVVPSSTTTHGIGGAWEFRRGGYSVVANGTLFRRSSWKEWGEANDLQTSDDSRSRYAKYSVVVSRDFHLNAFQKIHVDAGMFGGRHLDRFSRYQFGMFDDTKIHGVPASGIRFDELRILRGGYSFNIFDLYRLDLFLDQAWGRDRPAGREWRPLTGTGVGVNVRAPWNTILRVDFGHSFVPERYRGLGSTTLQIMFLKPLK
jgi:hypothetical protein